MSNEVVAKRYATALFQLGQEKSKLETFEEELRTIGEVFRKDKQLNSFLKHPRIRKDKKKQLLRDVFQGYSEEVTHTLDMSIDRHREDMIPAMVDAFIERTNEARGIAEAKVYSVRALGPDEEKMVQDVFSKKLNKQTLRIHNVIDPSLLGGIKLRIGNRIYDGSVSGKLERIERKLVSANK